METPPSKSGSPSGLLPLALALAAFLASFAVYSVALGWNQVSEEFKYSVSAGVVTVTPLPSAQRWIDFAFVQNGTLYCGDDEIISDTNNDNIPNVSLYCDEAIVWVTTGTGVSTKSFQMAFSTSAPATPELGAISVDTSAIEEVLVSIGGIGLIALFLYGVGMSHHILSKV